MKKIFIYLATFVFILSSWNMKEVNAVDYYENHQDWNRYCMRGRNVTLTDTQFRYYQSNNRLHEAISSRCELVIKTGNPNRPFRQWAKYSGSVTLDLSDLNGKPATAGTSGTAVFYMNSGNHSSNYLGIVVYIVADTSSGHTTATTRTTTTRTSTTRDRKTTTTESNKATTEESNNNSNNGDSRNTSVNTDTDFATDDNGQDKQPVIEDLGEKDVDVTDDDSGKNKGLIQSIKDGDGLLGWWRNLPMASKVNLSLSFFFLLIILITSIEDVRMLIKYKRDKEAYLCSKYKK